MVSGRKICAVSAGGPLTPSHLAECARHDADDLVALAVQRDGLPDNRGVAAEAAAPERFGEDRHAVSAGPFVFGEEAAARKRRQAEYPEHRRRDRAAEQPFRLTVRR